MLKTATRFVTKFTRSLSFKLSFYTAFIMFLALLAFAYHSISAQEDNLITKMIQGALKDSEVIKAAIWNGMMTKDRAVIKQIVQTIGSQEGFKEINIYDAKGVLHYTSKPDLANERLSIAKESAAGGYRNQHLSATHNLSEREITPRGEPSSQ